MATPQPQEKPAHVKETWPLRDDEYTRYFEETLSSSVSGCIGGLCWWRRNTNGYMVQAQAEEVRPESWVKRKAKKLKEISEVLAGPRWKNFIRRFSTYGINKKRRSMMMQFQYDPQSYPLNFDHREAGAGFPDFSARFAAPAAIHKGDNSAV
ncbi:hypothetical protein F3Y22_tig00111008pilonHSYRG00205 [Hibiscus syriacus]|uniref:Uncharacterized protein n=1 Tax=Hibiscus syriacus TaxID=106335 RepID=A0A6A2Z7C3_HIBSY|nr:hypothetical protein F3Y22_tig00111008pilonHSYRG00205 [Hibiscus syriacus]